jgi:hypothetical protein
VIDIRPSNLDVLWLWRTWRSAIWLRTRCTHQSRPFQELFLSYDMPKLSLSSQIFKPARYTDSLLFLHPLRAQLQPSRQPGAWMRRRYNAGQAAQSTCWLSPRRLRIFLITQRKGTVVWRKSDKMSAYGMHMRNRSPNCKSPNGV